MSSVKRISVLDYLLVDDTFLFHWNILHYCYLLVSFCILTSPLS